MDDACVDDSDDSIPAGGHLQQNCQKAAGSEAEGMCRGTAACIFATIIDVGGYYKAGNAVGVFGRSSFLIFIVVLGIESARQTVARLKKVEGQRSWSSLP